LDWVGADRDRSPFPRLGRVGDARDRL